MIKVSHKAKDWIALWTVYIVWGSTYLGIELASETIPPFLAAGTRFLIAGTLMLGIVAWRRGTAALRLTKPEAASAAARGLPQPRANSWPFRTHPQAPIAPASPASAAV